MDLELLFGGSYVNWEGVSASWSKRTISSRLMIFAARRYLDETNAASRPEREEIISQSGLPEEVMSAFSAPPDPSNPPNPSEPSDDSARRWGEFVDAALVCELEMVSYGERPPILAEVRAGLDAAAEEAGERTDLGRWFAARRDALPGGDLPDDPEIMPV